MDKWRTYPVCHMPVTYVHCVVCPSHISNVLYTLHMCSMRLHICKLFLLLSESSFPSINNVTRQCENGLLLNVAPLLFSADVAAAHWVRRWALNSSCIANRFRDLSLWQWFRSFLLCPFSCIVQGLFNYVFRYVNSFCFVWQCIGLTDVVFVSVDSCIDALHC